METNFNEIKQEILRRAKGASACKSEYSKAYAAENLSELLEVIKDNFNWVCSHDVLTIDLIEQYKEDFATNGIYANQNVKSGYLLCHNAKVVVSNSAKVVAHGNATVVAHGNATVVACKNAVVEAFDHATVRAFDRSTVRARYYAKVVAYGSTKIVAYDSALVEAHDNSKVEAYDDAICISYDNN